jgi:serine/threonine protein kinase
MSAQIGQYAILSELGAGGMGVVYRALDVDLQREVALKRLRSEFAASPAVLERFRREAQLQGRLNHPNIAQLHSLVQTPDAFCIVMEFIEGVVLKDLVPLPWQQAVPILLQALSGLGYAHSQGVLHRDVKPENILIDRRGTVKVMDFGIAHAVGAERITREKALIGTIEYMPPERIQGGQVDNRSDIYAMGILLFEVLTGRLPYSTTSEYELLKWHIEIDPPPLAQFIEVPDGLDQVLQKAAAKQPKDRYSSCEEMAEALKGMCLAYGVDARVVPIFAPKVLASASQSVSTPEQRRDFKGAALTRIANSGQNDADLSLNTFPNVKPEQKPWRRVRLMITGALIVLGASVLVWFFAFRQSRSTASNAKTLDRNAAVVPTENLSPLTATQQPHETGSAADELVRSIEAPDSRSNANTVKNGQEIRSTEKKSSAAARPQAGQMDARRMAEEAALADKQHELELKAAEQEARQKQLEQDQIRVEAEKQQAQEATQAAEKMKEQASAAEAERNQEQVEARQRQAAVYRGPSSGVIVWKGMVKGVTLITINGNSSDVGQIISGELPGVLVMIQPADSKHVVVASTPAPSNSYQRLTLRVQGNGDLQESIRWSIP